MLCAPSSPFHHGLLSPPSHNDFGSPPNERLLVPPPSRFQHDTPSSPTRPCLQSLRALSFTPINTSSHRGSSVVSTPRYISSVEYSPVRSAHRPSFSRGPSTPTRSSPPPLIPAPYNGRQGLSDDSHDDSNRSYEGNSFRSSSRTTLPQHTLDPSSGAIAYSLEQILGEKLFKVFACDKSGCHFLQENYPSDPHLRSCVISEVCESPEFFEEMCKDVFANFFVQKMIEMSVEEEQRRMAACMEKSMFELCMNRYSCRVVQKAIEVFPDTLKVPLLNKLHGTNLATLTVDQNANHVIQKIFTSFDLRYWAFIISELMEPESFFQVVENKYGCRVIQLAIELLSDGNTQPLVHGDKTEQEELLRRMMSRIVASSDRLSSNEFANYVIQHVIRTKCLYHYRDMIIERCLMRKLLSLSQEKYASHVVEKAMEHASAHLLTEMLDEIFDGYVPHPDTKKDALDILLFHQFGNYVVQRMLNVCIDPNDARLDGTMREHWLRRLTDRIEKNTSRLQRYSSGKKILDIVNHYSRSHPFASHRLQDFRMSSSPSKGSWEAPDRFR